MIRINLLPAELESAPMPINPAVPIATAAILPLLIIIPIHLGQIAQRKHLDTEVASLKNELDRYQPIIAQVEALEGAKAQLTNRKNVIQQLETERLRYPQFMDDFVKLLPGNLWLSNLTTVTPANTNTLTVSMEVTALDNYDKHIKSAIRVYEERRNVLVDGLKQLGWAIERPKAAPLPVMYSGGKL